MPSEQVQALRREKWIVGAAIKTAVSYWDGQEWQGTNANVNIISRDGNTAIGVIVDVRYFGDGRPANGFFNGKQVTIDVPNGRARIEVNDASGF